MNLSEATQIMELRKQPRTTVEDKITKKALDVAARVLEISAAFGEPYTEHTATSWARKWLASKRFVLAEIAPHQVAIPFAQRINKNKVAATFRAAGDTEIEPIVVDLNKMGIGKTTTGYIPSIVVVDGKHRHQAQTLQGRDRIMAWVGELALEELQARNSGQARFIVRASGTVSLAVSMTKMSSTAELYAAVGSGLSPVVSQQDTGDGGSRTTKKAMPSGMSFEKVKATGAGGSGAGSSGQNPERFGVYSESERDMQKNMGSPSKESPGSGVGPRLKSNTGASRSEFSQKKELFSGPIRIKKIVTKKKKKSKNSR